MTDQATPKLPDRPMTAEERRGFRIACACFATWGRQIEHNGFRLGGATTPVPGDRVMQHAGRMVRYCGEALDRTLGNPGGTA